MIKVEKITFIRALAGGMNQHFRGHVNNLTKETLNCLSNSKNLNETTLNNVESLTSLSADLGGLSSMIGGWSSSKDIAIIELVRLDSLGNILEKFVYQGYTDRHVSHDGNSVDYSSTLFLNNRTHLVQRSDGTNIYWSVKDSSTFNRVFERMEEHNPNLSRISGTNGFITPEGNLATPTAINSSEVLETLSEAQAFEDLKIDGTFVPSGANKSLHMSNVVNCKPDALIGRALESYQISERIGEDSYTKTIFDASDRISELHSSALLDIMEFFGSNSPTGLVGESKTMSITLGNILDSHGYLEPEGRINVIRPDSELYIKSQSNTNAGTWEAILARKCSEIITCCMSKYLILSAGVEVFPTNDGGCGVNISATGNNYNISFISNLDDGSKLSLIRAFITECSIALGSLTRTEHHIITITSYMELAGFSNISISVDGGSPDNYQIPTYADGSYKSTISDNPDGVFELSKVVGTVIDHVGTENVLNREVNNNLPTFGNDMVTEQQGMFIPDF